MIVVTGAAGFIGSNLIKGLNAKGYTDILAVDDLTDGKKFANLVDLQIVDYMDKDEFIMQILAGDSEDFIIDAIFHQGACSATTEWNGKFMMENNYEYSKDLLHYCIESEIPFLYASSAAVYGGRSAHFIEDRQYEKPLNVYGYSKFLFDQYVRDLIDNVNSPICGFRYFNVYGPRENHKGSMASVAYHLNDQLNKGEKARLFEGSESFRRDFIYVDDVVAANIWFFEQGISGIFNCGTGRAESFQDVANAVLKHHPQGELEMIPFPEHLKGCYQAFTQADLTAFRETGCPIKFKTVAEGTDLYMQWLKQQ